MSYVAVISWTYQYIIECPIEAASSTAILQLVRPIFIKVEHGQPAPRKGTIASHSVKESESHSQPVTQVVSQLGSQLVSQAVRQLSSQ